MLRGSVPIVAMSVPFVFVLYITSVLAGTTWNAEQSRNTAHGIHYDQHAASVQAGRRGVEQRLSTLGSRGRYMDPSPVGTGCARCDGDQYGVGVGYVAFTDGSTSNSHHSAYGAQSSISRRQNIAPVYIAPSAEASTSYAAVSQRSSQRRTSGGPVLIPVVGSESESYTGQTEHGSRINTLPVAVTPVAKSQSYSAHSEQQRIENQRGSAPGHIYAPIGSKSKHYSSQDSDHLIHRNQSPMRTYSPTHSTELYRSDSESQVARSELGGVVPVFVSSNDNQYSDRSEPVETTQRRQTPSFTSGKAPAHYHRSIKEGQELRAETSYPNYHIPSHSGSEYQSSAQSERHNARTAQQIYIPSESSSPQHGSQQRHISPIYAPSENYQRDDIRFRQGSHTRNQQITYEPTYLTGSERYFSSQPSETLSQTEPRLPVMQELPVETSSSRSSSTRTLTHGNAGYYPVGGVSSSEISSRTRFGTTSGSNLIMKTDNSYRNVASSSLQEYMAESERLAQLQAQHIQSGGVRTGSTVLDANLVSAADLDNPDLHGKFHRSKSWEKTSKWASGTEYGGDGRPVNYNYLSTAESEMHNLDGKKAGYKAATTTLDDDGKVSTYSIHTP